jgi:DNA polymerase-3 subunit epsilon
MTSFAVIDFETANGCLSSICSVGVVIVRNGKTVNRIYRLIQPEPNCYWHSFTKIHGLTAKDTENAPVFPDVWAEIAPQIVNLPLVAHNSPFDEGCLRTVFRTYQMDYPDYKFHCTCRAARRMFVKGKDLPDHQLHSVAILCGYDLANHHHALADAEACAAIAIKIL